MTIENMNREDALDIIGDTDVGVGLGDGLELVVGRTDRMVRIALSSPGALNIAIELLVRCRDASIEEAKREYASTAEGKKLLAAVEAKRVLAVEEAEKIDRAMKARGASSGPVN